MATTLNPVKFPQFLHKPYRVVWFESDDLILIFLLYGLSMLFSLYVFLALPALLWMHRRFRDRKPRAFLRHVPYFLGFTRFSRMPPFFDRQFQE